MAFESLFVAAFVYLLASVIAVPVAKRLGLSSVLGYLVAGILIGPFVLGFVGKEGEDVMHFAEFGVVLMLFLIGLELEPSLLWRLRGPILGLGGMQVGVTILVVMGIALACGLPWQMSLVVGMALALSSTAIVLQTLQEKELTKTTGGQSAFSVLLFQDMAVIPMLALVPILATLEKSSGGDHGSHGHDDKNVFVDWLSHQAPWVNTILVMLAVVAIVVAGTYLIRPLLRAIARTRVRETFTAFALLLVIGIALLMTWLGVSPALGTFLAGVVLANSEYRHELESDIEPFKGILLGVFFISVGASIDFSLIVAKPFIIAGIVAGLILCKATVLFFVGGVGKLAKGQRVFFALALAQGSEFAFVLLGFSLTSGALTPDLVQMLVAGVAISMAMTPLILLLEEKMIRPRLENPEEEKKQPDEIDESAPVILAGFGRFGNFVGRMLQSQRIPVTVIDHDSDHIEFLRKLGIKAYFGDVLRPDLLESAGAAEAKLLVIAIEDPEKTSALVEVAKKHFPDLKILARAADRPHLYELIREEVDFAIHQHSGSAVEMGAEVLKQLGYRGNKAARAARWFFQYDAQVARDLAAVRSEEGEKAYICRVRERLANLEEEFERDARAPMDSRVGGWDNEALKAGVRSGGENLD